MHRDFGLTLFSPKLEHITIDYICRATIQCKITRHLLRFEQKKKALGIKGAISDEDFWRSGADDCERG